MMRKPERPLILASASATRLELLARAGLALQAIPAAVDEPALKQSARRQGWNAAETALALAQLKAERISRRHPDALVIGADQLLVCEDRWLDKPDDLAGAGAQLAFLSGKTHRLETAVCVFQAGGMIWHHLTAPVLTMRPLSPAFIAEYLQREGETLISSVGAYRLEALGSQLFSHIDGDFFTILGLPLLALLAFLRQAGALLE